MKLVIMVKIVIKTPTCSCSTLQNAMVSGLTSRGCFPAVSYKRESKGFPYNYTAQ